VNQKIWILKVLGSYAIIKVCNLGIVLLTYLSLCFTSYERINFYLMIGNLLTNVSISVYIHYLFVANFFINDGVTTLPQAESPSLSLCFRVMQIIGVISLISFGCFGCLLCVMMAQRQQDVQNVNE
jgi:hypothetical protein